MAKKKTRRPKTQPRNPWRLTFNEQIVRFVVYPALNEAASEGVASIKELHAKFQARHNCTVPYGTFRDWLKLLGLYETFTTRTPIYLANPARFTARAPLPHDDSNDPRRPLPLTDPMGGDDDVQFTHPPEPPAEVAPVDHAAIDRMLASNPQLAHLAGLGSPPPSVDGGAARPVTFLPPYDMGVIQ